MDFYLAKKYKFYLLIKNYYVENIKKRIIFKNIVRSIRMDSGEYELSQNPFKSKNLVLSIKEIP